MLTCCAFHSHGPVILHICGEYTCQGILPARLFPLQLAYEHNALVVSLEHRFFGKSFPFPETNSSTLPYLNSRQALNDLAYFQQWFQDNFINKKYGTLNQFNKYLIVGGSYPGALSAW